jgi:hypothetical protein
MKCPGFALALMECRPSVTVHEYIHILHFVEEINTSRGMNSIPFFVDILRIYIIVFNTWLSQAKPGP